MIHLGYISYPKWRNIVKRVAGREEKENNFLKQQTRSAEARSRAARRQIPRVLLSPRRSRRSRPPTCARVSIVGTTVPREAKRDARRAWALKWPLLVSRVQREATSRRHVATDPVRSRGSRELRGLSPPVVKVSRDTVPSLENRDRETEERSSSGGEKRGRARPSASRHQWRLHDAVTLGRAPPIVPPRSTVAWFDPERAPRDSPRGNLLLVVTGEPSATLSCCLSDLSVMSRCTLLHSPFFLLLLSRDTYFLNVRSRGRGRGRGRGAPQRDRRSGASATLLLTPRVMSPPERGSRRVCALSVGSNSRRVAKWRSERLGRDFRVSGDPKLSEITLASVPDCYYCYFFIPRGGDTPMICVDRRPPIDRGLTLLKFMECIYSIQCVTVKAWN